MTWAKQSKSRRAQVITSLLASASSCPIVDTQAYSDAAALLRQADEPVPKGYPKGFALQVLIVEGTGPFPLAMLTRDSAFPASEDDASRMSNYVAARSPKARRVELRRVVGSAKGTPHVLRWQSFGWNVVWYGPMDKRVDAIVKLRRADAMKAEAMIAWDGIEDPEEDLSTKYDGGICDIVNRNNGWVVCFTPHSGAQYGVIYAFDGGWSKGVGCNAPRGIPVGQEGSITRREARLFAESLMKANNTP